MSSGAKGSGAQGASAETSGAIAAPDERPSSTETRRRGDLGRLVALAALSAVMFALVGPGGDFPLNDDWVYARSVNDGGYEYNGWRGYDSRHRQQPGKSRWWVEGDDYVVASGPVAGYREVASYPFTRWLLGAQSRIVVLQR